MRTHRTMTVAICMLFSLTAYGQDKTLIDSVKTGCEKELSAFCTGVTPGEGRQLACLYAHQDKLSNRCEYALYDASSRLERAISAASYVGAECGEDLQKHCADETPGGGRILQCLKNSDKELTARCKEALKDVEK